MPSRELKMPTSGAANGAYQMPLTCPQGVPCSYSSSKSQPPTSTDIRHRRGSCVDLGLGRAHRLPTSELHGSTSGKLK
jgi:hypothetical protein